MSQWENLSQLLEQKIDDVVEHSQLLEQMTITAQACLPGKLAPHCRIDRCKNNEIVVAADTSGHASLIYFYHQEILQGINKEFARQLGCRFTKLRLIVNNRQGDKIGADERAQVPTQQSPQTITQDHNTRQAVSAKAQALSRRPRKAK